MTSTRLRKGPSKLAHETVKVLDAHMRVEGMSRRQLAKLAGVHERTLADWWYGKGSPNVFMLEACLNVFHLRLKASAMGFAPEGNRFPGLVPSTAQPKRPPSSRHP